MKSKENTKPHRQPHEQRRGIRDKKHQNAKNARNEKKNALKTNMPRGWQYSEKGK